MPRTGSVPAICAFLSRLRPRRTPLTSTSGGFAFASAALKEADPAAEPVRVALLLEKRAMLGKHGGVDPTADLRAALELVPAGLDDAARARVLVSEAKSLDSPCGPEARLAAEEALTLA